MQLSSQIPRMLGQVAPQALQTLFENASDPHFWAIHPGGRSIVDQIEQVFRLTPEHVAPSRAVLRRYGNMSSPTILFVLKDVQEQLREQQLLEGQEGVAMAFGPGLVTEMARLTYYPTRVTVADLVDQPEEEAVDALA
jgi:predicted naringenin-chalcone synthase